MNHSNQWDTERATSPAPSRTSTAVNFQSAPRTYIFQCIPSRFAMFIFTPLLFVIALFMSVMSIVVADGLTAHVSNIQKVAIFFQIFMHVILCIACIVGFVSACRKSLKAAQFYNGILIAQLLFGIAIGIMSMYMVFKGLHHAASLAPAAAGAAAGAAADGAAAAAPAAADAAASAAGAAAGAAADAASAAAPAAADAAGAAAGAVADAAAGAAGAAAGAAADAAAAPAAEAAGAAAGAAADAAGAAAGAVADAAGGAAEAAPAVAARALESCSQLGEGISWVCDKPDAVRGLMVVSFLALWFTEILSIYTGVRFVSQIKAENPEKELTDDQYYGSSV